MAQPLPRQLWELRSASAPTSMLMLRMLHSAAVYAPPGGPLGAALQGLQGQLAPCFLSVRKPQQQQQEQQPMKGAQKPKQGGPKQGSGVKIVAGPLVRLPSKCQVRHLKSFQSADVFCGDGLKILLGNQYLQILFEVLTNIR